VIIAFVLLLVWFVGVPLGVVAMAALYSRRAPHDAEATATARSSEWFAPPPLRRALACELRVRSRAGTASLVARRGRRAP
jgi:hypothetical protein